MKTGAKAGPIAPGDEILLMSGNYGNAWINIWNAEISNSAFVTVAAAPGQTPILTSLYVGGTNNWAFSELKVQSLVPATLGGRALVHVSDGGATLPTANIVFESVTISSQDNVADGRRLNGLRTGVRDFGLAAPRAPRIRNASRSLARTSPT